MNTTITTLIEKGIADKHLAGAIVQVTQKEEPFFQEAFGIHSLNDRIDAGNLVEVVAILPLILKLVERRLDLLLMSNTDLTKEYKLLTTIPDLSRFATMVAQDGTFDFIKVINWKAVQLSKQNFTSFLNEDRGLGWAIQKDSKTAYRYLDEPTTSMWFIPEKEYNIVLHLTPFSEGEEEGLLEIRKKILSLLEKQD